MFVINGVHTSVIPLIAPLCTCWPFEEGKGRESSVLDANAGYIHCTNNQYNPISTGLFYLAVALGVGGGNHPLP